MQTISILHYQWIFNNNNNRWKLIPLTFSVVCLCSLLINHIIIDSNAYIETAIESIYIFEDLRMCLTLDTLMPPFFIDYYGSQRTFDIRLLIFQYVNRRSRKVAAKTVILIIWKHLMNSLLNCGTLTFLF